MASSHANAARNWRIVFTHRLAPLRLVTVFVFRARIAQDADHIHLLRIESLSQGRTVPFRADCIDLRGRR